MPELPDKLDDLFGQALAKDHSARFNLSIDMVTAFESILQDAGLFAPSAAVRTPSFRILTHAGNTPPQLDTPIISPEQAAEQERRVLGQIEAEKQNLHITTPVHRRSVNSLPQDVSGRYVGRDQQQADIMSLLREKARLISIYGRSGIGKTALVCKILTDLQLAQDGSAPDGMVYLSGTGTGISLERILLDFGKLLGGEDGEALSHLATYKPGAATQKTATLDDNLTEGRYALLLPKPYMCR